MHAKTSLQYYMVVQARANIITTRWCVDSSRAVTDIQWGYGRKQGQAQPRPKPYRPEHSTLFVGRCCRNRRAIDVIGKKRGDGGGLARLIAKFNFAEFVYVWYYSTQKLALYRHTVCGLLFFETFFLVGFPCGFFSRGFVFVVVVACHHGTWTSVGGKHQYGVWVYWVGIRAEITVYINVTIHTHI